MKVLLTKADRAFAKELAALSYEKAKSIKNPEYLNTPAKHFRGKLGEIAFSKVLTASGILHLRMFELLDDSKADIVLRNAGGIEVKTWDEVYWIRYGRAITVKQYPKIAKKSKAVVWATTDTINVELMGWNFTEEICQFPVIEFEQRDRKIIVPNYVVPIESVRELPWR